MIDRIILDNLNLKAFAGAPVSGAPSQVFTSKVEFHKGASYLVEAGSGRGKSSFCAFLCGLRNDYTGSITFGNKTLNGGEKSASFFVQLRRESIAVMFQDYKLFPELTAVENVMLKSQLTGYSPESEVRSMLTRLGLAGHIDRPCTTLSLGQQQRVAFVRALAQPCDFILLDEPISHLDAENANEMSRMLRERQQRDNIGVIVTSIGYRLPYDYDAVLNL
jgi:ABC-type lipoprotein export system ATPase subunit